MYAIVDIAGQQFKVEKNKKIFVHRLEDSVGNEVEFDKILLVDDNGKIKVGDPVVKNMLVKAKVLEHLKGDKVLVFKKKRRKGYQKLNGHRQYLTALEVLDIATGTATKKAEVVAKPKDLSTEKAKTATTTKASETAKKPDTTTKKDTATTDKAETTTTKKTTAAKKTGTTKKPTEKKAATTAKTTTKKTTTKKPAAKKPTTTKKSPSAESKGTKKDTDKK